MTLLSTHKVEVVPCACGCGEMIPAYDRRGRRRRFRWGHRLASSHPPDGVCSLCGTPYPRWGGKRGCKMMCRKCYAATYHHRRRERDPEHERAIRRRSLQRLRKAVLEKFGNQCVCCGETEPRFLALDHRHGGGARARKEKAFAGIYREALHMPNAEAKYRLLCHNCNMARSLYGHCPHEETTGPIDGWNKYIKHASC